MAGSSESASPGVGADEGYVNQLQKRGGDDGLTQVQAGPSRHLGQRSVGTDPRLDAGYGSSASLKPTAPDIIDPRATVDAPSASATTPRAAMRDLHASPPPPSRYPASLAVAAPTYAFGRPGPVREPAQGAYGTGTGPGSSSNDQQSSHHYDQPSPSKMAFDKQTTFRRHTSRSSSPSGPTSPPHRIPSPSSGSIPWTSHADGFTLGVPNPALDIGGGASSSPTSTSQPFLSLPRARSPDALSVTSTRSQSPVSPHSSEFPHTAPLGSGSFGARRYSKGGGTGRKRPMPLDLTKGPEVGVDPELQVHMNEVATARSARSSGTSSYTSLSHEMNDLSLLRNTIRQNLHDRPIGSISDHSDSGPSEPPLSSAIQQDLDPSHTISASDLHDLHNSAEPHVILDCRSPVAYGQEHMDGSLNVSIPTLIVKRLRKGVGSKPTWETVGSYIAGQDGKQIWEGLKKDAKVVLLGETGRDEVARILRDVVGSLLGPNGSAQILSGGWGNLHLSSNAVTGRRTVSGSATQPGQGGMLPPPRASRLGPVPGTAPIASQPSVFVAPPTPPNVVAPRLANQISMPSLRARRAQDQLNSGKRLPQLSLNVAPPVPARAATLDTGKRPPKSPGMLTINTGVPNAASPATSPTSHAFPTTARKSTFGNLPLRSPTSKTFSGSFIGSGTTAPAGSKTPAPLTSLPQRAGQMVENQHQHMIDPSDIPAGAAPGSARPAIAPFLVSTIIPNFLYLGPEILEQHEVDELKRLGVKRILNVAIECDDDGGLGLSEVFDEYHHIPMRDMVEEHNLGAGIKDAVAFLDDARLRDSPTYVHCKAGKSRSVTIVLAYLIHANAWTLKTAYSFVSDRRPGISPNIGFVAELMQYAEVELGLRQHRAEQGDDNPDNGGGAQRSSKIKRVRARDSMPAAAPGAGWSSSLQANQGHEQLSPIPGSAVPNQAGGGDVHGTAPEPTRKVDEREIRREGVWVQHRRAPKDERLRPSRRVSKAGLETFAAFALPRTPSPHPASTFTSKPATPLAEGKASWS